MENQNANNRLGVAKNPIGVIGLFLVLVEAIAAFVVTQSSLPYSLNLILVLFIALFPLAVLLVFYMLVTRHHKKLYSPSDFKDEKNFVNTYDSATQIERFVEVDTTEGIETTSAKEGMSISDINLIKDSLNTIVSMQKSLTDKDKEEETAIVEHAEKTINERLDSYFIEKEIEYKTSVSYINGSRQFVKDLNRKGYLAEIYFGVDGKSTQLKKYIEHEAIWLGKRVPIDIAIEIIKMAKMKFPHLKYIELSPDHAPEYVQYEIYIGGATSTALKEKLNKLALGDFEKMYECQNVEDLHEYIINFNKR